jgi:putative membrane-bound dehydrogenase-like protein
MRIPSEGKRAEVRRVILGTIKRPSFIVRVITVEQASRLLAPLVANATLVPAAGTSEDACATISSRKHRASSRPFPTSRTSTNMHNSLTTPVVSGRASVRGFASFTASIVLVLLPSVPWSVPERNALGQQPRRAEYTPRDATEEDESLIFTPPGFSKIGLPIESPTGPAGTLELSIRDATSGEPLPCRINVVGPDGNYYEPLDHPLKQYSLTGQWPNWPMGWGNRPGKAPIRYCGRFFYCLGDAQVLVPAGTVRIEVWRGYEYRPEFVTTNVLSDETKRVEVQLTRAAPMSAEQYYSGDTHLHIERITEEDDQRILDLLAAEDVQFGVTLAYNEPAGPYLGSMQQMATPQRRGLGLRSAVQRDGYHLMSGQEYRSATYGHMNLYLMDHLVLGDQSINANNWPLYGDLVREVRRAGGIALYAHGGYAQAIYADVVQGNIDAVELLQFGIYRGIGLLDWYHMLNCGFRLPIIGASDYPACRKLADAVTYTFLPDELDGPRWLRAATDGRSFVTTGPLILLDVDGRRPGETTLVESAAEPHTVNVRLRVRSEVAPVTQVQIVVNGHVHTEWRVPVTRGQHTWLDFTVPVELTESSWIAARAFSESRLGTPDSEAHTNPVHVVMGRHAPYNRESLDALVERLDKQIAVHRARDFAEKAKVLAYFERSRDILMKIRERGGAPADGHPSELLAAAELDDPGRREHTEEELRRFLRPVPPKSPQEAVESFETQDGFRMELVAHEPLVVDPIAAAFDENGNLYVCEMRDYPYKPQSSKPPLGTIRLLRDTNDDGRFDQAHVFADELLWPAGVVPWKGGVFVAAPPDIWYLKDTTGDHRADVRQKVFRGFGTENQQAMVNNLQWGLDHRIYGSTAGNGGKIRVEGEPDVEPVSVQGRDFRFDPATGTFETVTGTVQFGNAFDDWGNRYLCSESQPLHHVVLPQEYLVRNPYLPVPRALNNIAPGPVPIFRISPIERWRMIRSGRRLLHSTRPAEGAGVSHHVVDAAAGVTVYRGGAYPPGYYGQVFLGDAQNNLLHRRLLEPAGVTFTSRRLDDKTEFVRSFDNWFRPVNFVNAPDGTLYVLDMSREIIEAIHIPLDVVKHLDLRRGRDQGRIYRLAPPGFRYPGGPRLGTATTSELVSALESPHGWWRDTAHRLLYERQDQAAVPLLQHLLRHSPTSQARLHALWSLEGLVALRDDDLRHALRDDSAPLREHALRLAERRLPDSPSLVAELLRLRDDPEPRVRFQVAFSAGASDDPRALDTLLRLARQETGDPWMRAAIMSSVSGHAASMLSELLTVPTDVPQPPPRELLQQLATIVGGRADKAEVEQVIESLADFDGFGHAASSPGDGDGINRALTTQLLLSLGEGLLRGGHRLRLEAIEHETARAWLTHKLQMARAAAMDVVSGQEIPSGALAETLALLRYFPFADTHDTLVALLEARQTEITQLLAVRTLGTYAEAEVGTLLLEDFRARLPTVQREIIGVLLARESTTVAILEAIRADNVPASLLDASQRHRLREHGDVAIRDRANELLTEGTSAHRRQVVEQYHGAIPLSGDSERGALIFRRECSACHRVGDTGYQLGPNLAAGAAQQAEALLTHILDPNQYVLPNYVQYVVEDTSGRIYTGMISGQSATSITLTRGEQQADTLLRTNIERMESTGRSLMPEGLEEKISLEEMADLIAYLQSVPIAESEPPPLDRGTLPGLVEP